MKTIVWVVTFLMVCVLIGCNQSTKPAASENTSSDQARKNFKEMTDPRANLDEDDIIQTIQADSAESIKTDDWLAKETDKTEALSDIIDRDIRDLQFRTAQGITNWNNCQDLGPARIRQGVEKINAWEKQMEQNMMQAALEAKKHGSSDQDAESAILLAVQVNK